MVRHENQAQHNHQQAHFGKIISPATTAVKGKFINKKEKYLTCILSLSSANYSKYTNLGLAIAFWCE